MEKYRAIPEGYMKVGELAKKAGITTRTLRYYDKQDLLSPSTESEGGYRLYSDKDSVKLMQILMMKRLGFPLSEIKKRIINMDTTTKIVDVLTGHATNIRKEIEHLTESLNALETLKSEIVQLDSVDFKKFAAILESIYMKNEYYWLVKYFDNDVLDIFAEETTSELTGIIKTLIIEAAKLQETSVPPESKRGQDFAARFWKIMMELTDGDIAFMQKMNEQTMKAASDEKYDKTMKKALLFMGASLDAYFNKDFFTEAAKLKNSSVYPESEQAQALAERYWNYLMELTGGDVAMLQKMGEQFEKNMPDQAMKESHRFMESSLGIYLEKLGKEGNT